MQAKLGMSANAFIKTNTLKYQPARFMFKIKKHETELYI